MNFEKWYEEVKEIIKKEEGSLSKLFDYPHTIKQFERYHLHGKKPQEAIVEFNQPHGNEHGEDIWE